MTQEQWELIQQLATIEVRETVCELPAPLRERAEALPVIFDRQPNALQLADGIEPDTLGLFIGPEYADQETTSFPVPPQIMLFLENIWEMVEGDQQAYREEVHTTYLHELGHYLGLDEDDLFDRGLE